MWSFFIFQCIAGLLFAGLVFSLLQFVVAVQRDDRRTMHNHRILAPVLGFFFIFVSTYLFIFTIR